VKVWCLPLDTPQEKLEKLHVEIVTAFMNESAFGVKDEMGLIVMFPKDLMSHGLGTDILIEVESQMNHQYEIAPGRVAEELVRIVGLEFPKAVVTCEVRPYQMHLISKTKGLDESTS
jgi:hypothetical protein